ncbi:MAG TPA: GTPase [Egicoccus sp.]|nr:GTPase [Egicoccus sp.]HSK24696.1 GTPase [Egicoccus sp.]
MRRRQAGSPSPDVAAALDIVVALGPGRLDDAVVADAVDLRRQLDERLARGEGLTVAALAGGTGVGKSALANALLRREVAVEGVRRPTTSVALAAMAERTPQADALLDWLEVPERVAVGDALPEGLVLLDLPDHDSVVEAHRTTAARLAERVDVVVWVVDPIKYARDDTHHGPLADLTEHAEVLLVVLNRADELTADGLEALRADLHRRLADGGHRDARVLATSARMGVGVDDLRAVLVDLAARRSAAAARLAADAAVFAERAGRHLDVDTVEVPAADAVMEPLLVAVDGHRAAAEAAGLYRREAARRSRSPLARVLGRPFRAAGVSLRRRARVADGPPPRAATVEGVETALLRVLDVGRTAGHTHAALHRAVGTAAGHAAPALTDAVAAADLIPAPRRWWTLLSWLRLAAETCAIVGVGWLGALAAVDYLRLPELPVPHVTGDLPWPTALLLGGLLVRIVLGVVTRLSARNGARRHAARVRRQIERTLRVVVEERLLDPLRREVDDQRRLRDAITALSRRDSR